MDNNLAYSIWKLSNVLFRWKIPLIPFFLQQVNRVLFCCLVPYKTKMGKNVRLSHLGMGIVINPGCIIGDNVKINQHVTLGGRGLLGNPTICDNVHIGAGAKIIGGVTIGKNAKIGANAVVLIDVPENATAIGVPARILNKNSEKILVRWSP